METNNLPQIQNTQVSLRLCETMGCDKILISHLLLAMERTGLELPNVQNTANDIFFVYKKHFLKDIIEALRLGSMGAYGVNHRLTTQIVGNWISQYFKEKENKKIQL